MLNCNPLLALYSGEEEKWGSPSRQSRKSSKNAEAYHVVLGEQADSQATRQDLCPLPPFRRRREDGGRKDVSRHGDGPTGQESGRSLPGVSPQIRP